MKVSTFILDTQGPAISINAPINKVYLGSGQIDAFENAMLKNSTESLGTDDKRIFFRLLNNNVKDVSAGLSGSFSDTYSEIGTKYWYSFNGGAWREEDTNVSTADNKNTVGWKINLTTQSDGTVKIPNGETLKDGLNSLSIRVKDSRSNGYDKDSNDVPIEGGYGYETNVNFILDTGTPVLSAVTGDLSDGNVPTVLGPMTSSEYVRVNGVITGTYMVKRLSVSLGSGATIALTNDGNITYQKGDTNIKDIHLEPVNATSKTFNYYFDVNTSGLAYGSRTITINALGSSDNSNVKTVSFIYDDKGPNVSVSVPSSKLIMTNEVKNDLNSALLSGSLDPITQIPLYNSLKTMLITDSSTNLSGTFNDEYSAVADKSTNNTFWWQIDGGEWKEGTLAVSKEKSVSWDVPISGLLDGVHLLSLRVKDEWGNGSDGTDLGNGGYENNIAFMIDRSVPEIKVTDAPPIPINGGYTFKGTITNTYGVKRLSVKLGNNELASIEEGQTKPGITLIQTPGNGRSFDFTFNIDPSIMDDGPASLVFNAIGSSGQVAMLPSSFTFDKTAPKITIGAPISESFYVTDDNQWKELKNAFKDDDFTGVSSGVNDIYANIFKTRIKDNSASFTITFNDDHSPVFLGGKDFFWFKLDDDTEWKPAIVDENDLNRQSVSIKLSPTAGAKWTDGVHRLSIRAVDSLGNGYNISTGNDAPETSSGLGYQSNLVFMIDSGAPVLDFKIDNPKSGIINTSTPLEISGTINGTYEVQDMSVKIGSTSITIASDAVKRTGNGKKEYSFAEVIIDQSEIYTATGGNEGSYTISVTVKGSSDQSEMKVNTFVLDTKGPAISINAPIKEKIYLTPGQRTDINAAIEDNDISI